MYYTYSIKNLENGKFYIGSRTAKCMLNRKPEYDLGIKYFSSSTDEELKQAIKDGKVEYHILQEYDDPKICWRAEQQLIALYWKFFGKDMSYNHSYINCEGDKIFSTAGVQMKETTKEKLSTAAKNQYENLSDKERAELSRKLKKAWDNKSDEEKQEIIEKCRNASKIMNANMTEMKRMKKAIKCSESKQGNKNPSYNKIWLCKGTEQIYINKSELDYYLSLGFKIGRKKYKWMTPDGEIKEMCKTSVTKYHPDWILVE